MEGQHRALNGIHPHVIKIMTDTLLKSLEEARAFFGEPFLEGQRLTLNGIHPHVIKIVTDALLRSLKEARAVF